MAQAYLIGGVRTATGRYGGALASVRSDDRAAQVMRALAGRPGLPDPGQLDEVVFGSANQAGEDNRRVALVAMQVQKP